MNSLEGVTEDGSEESEKQADAGSAAPKKTLTRKASGRAPPPPPNSIRSAAYAGKLPPPPNRKSSLGGPPPPPSGRGREKSVGAAPPPPSAAVARGRAASSARGGKPPPPPISVRREKQLKKILTSGDQKAALNHRRSELRKIELLKKSLMEEQKVAEDEEAVCLAALAKAKAKKKEVLAKKEGAEAQEARNLVELQKTIDQGGIELISYDQLMQVKAGTRTAPANYDDALQEAYLDDADFQIKMKVTKGILEWGEGGVECYACVCYSRQQHSVCRYKGTCREGSTKGARPIGGSGRVYTVFFALHVLTYLISLTKHTHMHTPRLLPPG